MGILQQEYWSGLPCPPPEGLPDTGMEPRSPKLQADSLLSEPPGKPLGFIFPQMKSHLPLLSPPLEPDEGRPAHREGRSGSRSKLKKLTCTCDQTPGDDDGKEK